jgi:CDP-paratose 2-epimerase
MLEVTRQLSPAAVFIYMSTNKVYGDAPNELAFKEYPTRYDYVPWMWQGFSEQARVDRSTHSVFGANKLAADIMVQEYARTFGLKTCVFRGGCLTGPGHSGVELHGFLSYLVKVAVNGGHYRVFGYKGKQVRDNIHSRDVARAMEEVIAKPRPGEVYNMGGGRANSVSVLEAIDMIERASGKKISWEYVDQARLGDHVCYITDLGKFKSHYPGWSVTKPLDRTIEEMVEAAR